MYVHKSFVCRILLFLTMLIVGIVGAWGQTGTDYSGIYYFVNCGSGKTDPVDPKIADITNPDDYFYLVPADNPQLDNKRDAWFSSDYNSDNGDPEKPYLTTYKTKKDAAEVPSGVTNRPHNSVWIVKFASTDSETDYYNIIHAATGKYVVYEPPYSNKNNRKSVHLLTTDNPGENAKFAITAHQITINSINYDCYNFRPKSIGTGNNTNKYLNAANANYNFYYSSDATADGGADYFRGLLGLWKNNGSVADGTGSDWKIEETVLEAPIISEVDANGKVTIADANNLPSGYEIRYTTDGTTIPTASTGTLYSEAISIIASVTIKAVVVRYGMVLTEVASEVREPVSCATPVITYDNATSKVSITCATTGSSIYYTIDGSTPTTSSTEYGSPFSVNSTTTVKAIATHSNLPSSAVAELSITQVDTPTIQNNGSNAISITTTTPGATIYYTTDGSNPTTSSTEYTAPLSDNVSNKTIKAIAVKAGMITSVVCSGTVKLKCATPVITRDGLTFTLSCSMPTDATLYYILYTLGGGSEETYTGTPVSFTSEQLPMTVTAVARHDDYTQSEITSMEFINGSGTTDDPYMIYGTTDLSNFVANVNAGTTSSAYYKLGSDVSASGIDAVTTPFTGTFDGNGYTISNLGHALFNSVSGGTVKNVILDNVGISGGTNVGAICGEATGDTRIYNCGILATNSTVEKDEDGYDHISSCGSTISGSGYVGGIVGLLDGSSRVINCFSYANVSGGSHVGGIVGYNAVATTAANLKTMVMNCMFYGEVSGTSIAPIYNGEIITNDGDADGVGVNNFNYFRLESSYVRNTDIAKVYNCALGAETRFLQRFEFFRLLLNSNRELAAWWAGTSTTTVTKDEMMKWVMEPTQIGTTTPYPILKAPGKYPSMVNYTPSETAYDEANRNKGLKLTSEGDGGVLHVTIQMGSGGAQYAAPSGAGLKSGVTGRIDLPVTDKDYEHFNFNYGKVQLPYYNDYCDGNYTENRVVTGWKIISIKGGTAGNYSSGDDVTYTSGELTATPYNFADRKSTNKDLYTQSGRVFNQGAYWDVPEGVTDITIEPYWGKAVYLADAYWDVVYKNGTGDGTAAGTAYDAMTTATDVPNVGGGQHYVNGESTFNSQIVFTSIGDAISSSKDNGLFKSVAGSKDHTVYDYAVVLVGNYHGNYTSGGNPDANESKPYTVTSVDLDGDNEPDYSFMLRFNGRIAFHPVRYDFLNLIGLGMAQKTTGGIGSYNLGIMQPKFWFEVTNTAQFRVTQFEYSPANRSKKPIILQGGVIEQWVTQQQDAGDRVEYFHVGGNVWFKEFHRGSHQDNTDKSTPHPPVSVTGGDYNKFYLTGYYQSKAAIYDDNAECYINGGRFGEVAGAGMEGIGSSDGKGNITWVIDHADIKEFYGGGINHAKPVNGNIHTIISNSYVDVFCGGPKFGDMKDGRTVTTTATNCTFGTYFGAGYGGNSYNRIAPKNHNNIINFPHNDRQAGNHGSWNAWLADKYKQQYNADNGGVPTRFDYQFLPMSSNTENVARIFVEYVGFSLATTHDVTSSLTGCTITGNFYGGGSLGKVTGNVTSTLNNCSVNGSVFGAGYSASIPTVEVDSTGFRSEPYYYTDLGTYRTAVKGATTTYTWQYKDQVNNTATAINTTDHILYTTEDLTALGTVTGKVTLNVKGTTVAGSVYGGGELSKTPGSVEVNVNRGTVTNDVFGGGKEGDIGGSVVVNMNGGTVTGSLYGGGALANTNTDNWNPTGGTDGNGFWATGKETKDNRTTHTTVNLKGGTIGGIAFGGGLGSKPTALDGTLPDIPAYIYGDVTVTLNGAEGADCKVLKVHGGNNYNGTPKGEITVNVVRTVAYDGTHKKAASKNDTTYDMDAVYGGGNEAAYDPADSDTKTNVFIDGCGDTSIMYVYGGGNAAPVSGTNVVINKCYEIGKAFGGGNGLDVMDDGSPNPGANVGYYTYEYDGATGEVAEGSTKVAYGSGLAECYVKGGTVHVVYGGSNTKGNVRKKSLAAISEEYEADCPLNLGDAYGGGNEAFMDGASELRLGCVSNLGDIYGGSTDADIGGDIVLDITSGHYNRVFGGNNKGGIISGSITVNIEETGCKPITIGELYGCGNQAPYTTPAGKTHPTINIKSFTSIGKVFGGGLGADAVVRGNPTVNIDEVLGKHADNSPAYGGTTISFHDDPNNPETVTSTVNLPAHASGKIGAIGTVYGGGNAAPVIGNTNINIGTQEYIPVTVAVGSSVTGYYTRSDSSPYTYYEASGTAASGTTYYKKVVGVDIRDDVFGAGLGKTATVSGNTNVVIGR